MDHADPLANSRNSPLTPSHPMDSNVLGDDRRRNKDTSADDLLGVVFPPLYSSETVTTLLSTLSKCAAVHDSQSELPQAIDCAALMITCSPQSPSGYRYLAKFYMKQGRAAAALAVLDNALTHVPKTADQYADIKIDRERARQRLDLRIDFISKLPPKVIYMIFISLGLRERLVCAEVSKTWQELLVSNEQAGLWSEIYLKSSFKWNPVCHVLRHCKILRMCNLAPNKAGNLFNYFVMAGSFKNVASFTLHSEHLPIHPSNTEAYKAASRMSLLKLIRLSLLDCDITPTQALLGLANMRNLTTLSLVSKEAMLSLAELTSTCPQLKTLRISQTKDSPSRRSPKNKPFPPNLKLESLTIMVTKIYQKELNAIVDSSPQLRNLFIWRSDITVLHHVDKSCPKIHVVVINPDHSRRKPEDVFMQEPYDDTAGLCDLEIYGIGSGRRKKEYIPLIDKNRHQLSKLVITPPVMVPLINTEKCVHDAVAARFLTWVEFHAFPKRTQKQLATFIRQCPLLSLVLFSNSSLSGSPEIFGALMELPFLKEFYLSATGADSDDLERFLDHHNGLQQKSTLKTLSLASTHAVTDRMLPKIASLSNLTSYRLCRCLSISRTAFRAHIKDMQSSNITVLQIGHQPGLTAFVLPSIGEIQSLRRLSFIMDTEYCEINPEKFSHLLNQSRELKPPLVLVLTPYRTDTFWRLWLSSTEGFHYERFLPPVI